MWVATVHLQMSAVRTLPIVRHPLSPPNASQRLLENSDTPCQEHVDFLRQNPAKPRQPQQHERGMKKLVANSSPNNQTSSMGSMSDRTPSSLFEMKQQRLVAAADRKKRLITRLVTIIGLVILLLCAIIVALTLKMAPQIDELVRTKTGAHQFVHVVSRLSSSAPTTTLASNKTLLVDSRWTFHTNYFQALCSCHPMLLWKNIVYSNIKWFLDSQNIAGYIPNNLVWTNGCLFTLSYLRLWAKEMKQNL